MLRSLTVKIQARMTRRYKTLSFVLLWLGKAKLIKIETASRILNYAASKGWLLQYRLDGSKWRNIMFGVDLSSE